jgi:NADH:ubiquinone reductase (H+-translocating)
VRVILVNSGGRILPEVTEDLSQFALQKIQESGVEVRLNTRLLGFDSGTVKLNDGTVISTQTLVRAGGGKPLKLISCLECEHDKIGHIITNEYLDKQIVKMYLH